MQDPVPNLRALFRELKRRRVYRGGAVYLVGAAAILQAADLAQGALPLPETLLSTLVIVAAAGFPVALTLSWAFDITSGGVRADEGGRLSDFLGGPLYGRLAVVGLVALLSGGAGWAGWSVWIGSGPESAEGAEPLDPTRIAVLYFDDHSPARDLGYLADGLTESLLNELARVEALEVVSRSGVKPFRDRAVPHDSIVAILRAGSLVEGSVNRSGDRIKVTVQLIDGATGAHLDSRVLERDGSELFALQDTMAAEVARLLRWRLGREIELRESRRGATSTEAWELVQRARRMQDDYAQLWRDDAEAGRRLLHRMDSLLVRAAELDPNWDLPLVTKALGRRELARLDGAFPGSPDPASIRLALEDVERALQRDSLSVDAFALKGRLLVDLWSGLRGEAREGLLDSAEVALRRALALDPDEARAWWDLSSLLVEEARFAEAEQAAEHALQSDAFLEAPLGILHSLYYAALQRGPTEEAIRFCHEGRRRHPGSSDFITCRLFLLSSFPQVEPDVERAWLLADSLVAVSSRQNRDAFVPYGRVFVAKVAARAGLVDSAAAVLDAAVRGQEQPELLYDEAHARLLMGDREGAMDALRRYVEEFGEAAWLAEDWWFEELHQDTVFLELVGATVPGG